MDNKRDAIEPKLRHKLIRWLAASPWKIRSDASYESSGIDVLERVLVARGLDSAESRDAFFNATIEDMPDPFLFKDMERATSIILGVMREKSPRILIFGDYDADGLTASALVARWFHAHGIHPDILIPDRIDDGYGLSFALVDEILLHRSDLVVTVDTGTTSSDLVALMVEEGVQVVVTDHHVPTLPFDRNIAPLINPSAEDEVYPYRGLSGAGVAFMLTQALDLAMGERTPGRNLLSILAAVGTVADVMPLTGVNRLLVRHGLEHFDTDAPSGLAALFSMTHHRDNLPISSRDIAFSIAPRLNAAGRMGDVRLALDLLLEDDAERAAILALQLDELNQERRLVESNVFDEALKMVTRAWGDKAPVIAIARGKDWQPGVLGIVSSRLAERLRVPAITLREEEGFLTGSARSFGSINLIQGLDAVSEYLDRYGGHSGAAGLQLEVDKFNSFSKAMVTYMRSIPEDERDETYEADADISPSAIDGELVDRLALLEPTGQDFGKAVFLIRRFLIEDTSRVGDGRHFKMRLRVNDAPMQSFDAILFHGGDEAFFYDTGDVVDVLATPEWNVWQGRATIQLTTEAIRPSCDKEEDGLAFDRLKRFIKAPSNEDLAMRVTMTPMHFTALWLFLEQLGADGDGQIVFSPSRLAWVVSHRYNVEADAFAVLAILSIFSDVGLCHLERTESDYVVFKPEKPSGDRPSLTSSPLWEMLCRYGLLSDDL
ncbi:MAG: single-stranded-DNA-specific exonuclease RecJ [Saccharofermentanales bacterium]|jgi:single-stranded-DNA-specific exonuclease